MKKAWPQRQITVFERNRPDDTFGFGVVFSDQTLDTFESYDRESYRAIIGNFAYWDDIEIHFRGTAHRVGGNGFCGCSRATCCSSAGAPARSASRSSSRPRFADPSRRSAMPTWSSRPTASIRAFARSYRRAVPAEHRPAAEQVLLDGLDPAVRRLHVLFPRDRARHLHRATATSTSRSARPGSSRPIPRPSRAPASTSSTKRQSARFARRRVRRRAQGPRLITNRSIWRNFPTIRCERWVADNMVLIGDAKATAHFSIGSGTKLAMEDAIALYEAFRSTGGRDVTTRARAFRDAAARGGGEDRSTPPTSRWSGSSTSIASGTWTRRASPSA